MEEEFFGSIKLVSGEEIFAEILPVEENGKTVLVVSDPVEIETVHLQGNAEGLRMMPWLRSLPIEGIVVIPMDRVITVVEAEDDSDVVGYYQRFIISNLSDGGSGKIKASRKMGQLGTVAKSRELLEKIWKKSESTEAE